jgi:penicillin-binding protein A
VFCNIGKQLGAGLILQKAKDFGFYSDPPIELPRDAIAASGLYDFAKHKLFDNPALVDPGRLAFGQERMLATPLQMALVAAGVANGGLIMSPRLVKEVRTPGGSLVERMHPKAWKRAMKTQTAAVLNQMMQAVVTGGTGRQAAIPGIIVAGKTGTAETNVNRVYDAWFIFFAPADDPQVAGAVVLEHQANGFGGSVAAPIARQLMQAILPATSKP